MFDGVFEFWLDKHMNLKLHETRIDSNNVDSQLYWKILTEIQQGNSGLPLF